MCPVCSLSASFAISFNFVLGCPGKDEKRKSSQSCVGGSVSLTNTITKIPDLDGHCSFCVLCVFVHLSGLCEYVYENLCWKMQMFFRQPNCTQLERSIIKAADENKLYAAMMSNSKVIVTYEMFVDWFSMLI